MEVAKAQWKQARDKLWPSLNLRGSYSDTKTTDSITKRKDYELAVYLNIPLYNRADRKQVEGVREGYLSYRARYLDKKRELTAQFEGLLEELKGLKTQLQALEKGVLAGALNLKKGEESYKNRLISIFDLYSAIESYYSTKLQLIDTQRQLLQNYLQLLQLQGELSLDKIGEIEKLYLKTN
jgi:outer membrane protein TolC